MKRVFLLLVFCLMSLYNFAVINGGNSGVGVTYYVQITDNGVTPSNAADFSFKAQIVGKDDWVNNTGLDCGIVTLAGRLYVKIYGGAFDKPFDLGISIEIELTQISTGKVIKKTITPTKVSGLERWDAPNGMDVNDGETPVVLDIKVQDVTLCSGVAGTATATVTGVEAGKTYVVTWNGGITTSGTGTIGTIPASLAEGRYTATVTSDGKTAFKEFQLIRKPIPDRPVVEQNPDPTCLGETVTLAVNNVQDGVTYAWSHGATGSSCSVTPTTVADKSKSYSVTPTLDGCAGPTSSNKSLNFRPDLGVGSPTITCKIGFYEASVTVTGGGVYGAYKNAACTQPTDDTQWSGNKVTFMKLPFGSHTYYINSDVACGVKPVTINDNGSCGCGATLAFTTGNLTFCEGASQKLNIKLTLNAATSLLYKKWSFDLKTPDGSIVKIADNETHDVSWDYTPTMSGTYTLVNFSASDNDGNSCGTIDPTAASRQVTINPKPAVTFAVSKQEGCFDENLTLTANPANDDYVYTWTGTGVPAGSTAAVVNMKIQAGNNPYKVKVKDKNNCESDVTPEQFVLGHQVVVSATATPSSIPNGTTSSLKAVVTMKPTSDPTTNLDYTWSPKEQLAAGGEKLQSPTTVNLTSTQSYQVLVKDNNTGCSGTDNVTVNVTGSVLAVTATGGSACEGTKITLGCAPTGGTGNGDKSKYKYEWTTDPGLNLSNTKIWNPEVLATTAPGTYKAKVMITDDANNTATSNEVTVEVKKMPKLTNIKATPSSGTNPIAAVQLTVDVDPSTGVDLLWESTPAGKILTGERTTMATTTQLTETTTFTIDATLNGCTAQGTVTVNVTTQELAIKEIKGSKGCKSGTVYTAEVTVEKGVPGYTYSWGASTPAGIVLNNTTTRQVTVTNSASLTAGTYTIPVTVEDQAGQHVTATATIIVYGDVAANPATKCDPAKPDVFEGKIMVTQGEKPYKIYSDMAGLNEVVVNWNAAGDEAGLGDLATGTAGHTYYVKDKNGCNTAQVTLNADCSCGAQLILTQGDKTCASSGTDIIITMVASGGTSYSFDLVNVELGTKVLQIRNDNANSRWTWPVKYADRGKYRVDNFVAVTTTSTPGTCKGNVFPNFVDIQFFPTPRVDAGPDQQICGTDKVTLKANGDAGLTFAWDNGVTDGVEFTPVMNTTTTYTVTATDANRCTNTDQVDVSASPKPNVSAMAVPNVVCKGDVVNLSHNGNADTYEWNNGGQDGPNNIPQTTTRYTVTGTNATTGCSDTSSVLVTVMLPAEIAERPKDRTIAIGKDVTYKIKAIGNNLTYEWQWFDSRNGVWSTFVDNTTTSPKISGSTTEELSLKEVPASWDGRKVKCIVTGGCGAPVEATANLWVKECFDIVADLQMGEGIRPETNPGSAVDGWYCKGNRISLKAIVALADPENGVVANPHYTWTIDGLPAGKVIESDSSVLSWVPEYWEDDIVVKVCIYSDGACSEACSRYLRLKARTPDDVKLQIVTSIDPERKFCPGDAIDFTVSVRNEGNASDYHWYRDIFDKGTGKTKNFVMNQKDTWVRVVLVPSPELCVEGVVSDSVFLQVKDSVNPTLYIKNNIGDTIACRGDELTFEAVYTDAGANPIINWRKDVWDIGTGKYAVAELEDDDMWIKCWLTPGNDVCYRRPALADSMVIRVMKNASVTITSDMEGKMPGDELTFVSTVENMIGNRKYEWYVNTNLTSGNEEDYVSSVLRQGDVVECAVSGENVCNNRVFSNQIIVKYGRQSRDTMVEIYRGESIKNLNMFKPGDMGYLFIIVEKPSSGLALMLPNGEFRYTPDRDFVGTDVVKYKVYSIFNPTKYEEGYIWITVKDNERFFVPNIITPNGDGLNDTWILDFLADYPDHLVTVFNGFSNQMVFQANHYQNDWDGTGKSKGGYVAHFNLPNGIYTYIIDLKDKNKTTLKGWLEIRADLNRSGMR